MSRRARQFVKRWTPQLPRSVPEIVLSPNLAAKVSLQPGQPPLPPVVRLDYWQDFTQSLRPLIARVVRRIRTGRL